MTIEQEVRRLFDALAREVTAIARQRVMELFDRGSEAPVPPPTRAAAATNQRRRERERGSTTQRARTRSKPTQVVDIFPIAIRVLEFMDHGRNFRISRDEIVEALGLDPDVARVVLRHLVDARRIILLGDGSAWYALAGRTMPRHRRRLATTSL